MFSVLGEMMSKSEARGEERGERRGENLMADKVQKALQELINNQQISKEAAAVLQSVTQQTGA